jgi:hypothetical protein
MRRHSKKSTRTRPDLAARNFKHGLSDTKLHARWLGMLARCCNPKHKAYPRYGGRGIQVCQRWRESFVAFVEDMGFPPTEKHTLDRINNDGHYEPGNVRWATNKENCQNTRKVLYLVHDGLQLTVSQWAERLGVLPRIIYTRIRRYGWSVARALTTPVLTPKEFGAIGAKNRWHRFRNE